MRGRLRDDHYARLRPRGLHPRARVRWGADERRRRRARLDDVHVRGEARSKAMSPVRGRGRIHGAARTGLDGLVEAARARGHRDPEALDRAAEFLLFKLWAAARAREEIIKMNRYNQAFESARSASRHRIWRLPIICTSGSISICSN